MTQRCFRENFLMYYKSRDNKVYDETWHNPLEKTCDKLQRSTDYISPHDRYLLSLFLETSKSCVFRLLWRSVSSRIKSIPVFHRENISPDLRESSLSTLLVIILLPRSFSK